jgi:DNA polymerase-3 subunit gamma/tau
MAYIALYRKWRPALFEDVVGQQHITETLQKAIDTDKVAHAYLFSGPRGTGKTSTAKIFAKAMNCIHGPTSHPCNECDVCRHITNGESLDVVEIDAASNRSIEDIRTLRETIKFMPAEGHKKIYIVDEVHMLTTEAFNALLKTLEEPPGHVIFILATTEPEKIPMTILSRCQRYEFRRITSGDIAQRLLYVAAQEGFELTKGAAHILAVQADGGMRDALSMLDQCVSNAAGTIDEALVRNLLGLIGKDWIFALSDAVFAAQGDKIIQSVDEIVRMGKEPRVLLTEMVTHLRALMLYQAAPQSDTLSAYADSMEELARQAKKLSPHRVFAILGVLQQALLTARTSPVPRVAVEMGLLMASRTVGSDQAEGLAERVAKLENQAFQVPQDLLDRITRLENQRGPVAAAPIPAADEMAVYAGLTASQQPVAFTLPPEPVTTEKQKAPAAKMTSAKPAVKPAAQTASTVLSGSQEYDTIWKGVCSILEKDKKRAVLSCMRNGHIAYMGEGRAIVVFKTEFMVKRANKVDYCQCVDAALQQMTGGICHMQGYLEGDSELAVYAKKKRQPVPEADSLNAAVLNEGTQQGLQPIGLEDIPAEARTVLDPLLHAMGDCNIYIEATDSDKKS